MALPCEMSAVDKEAKLRQTECTERGHAT